MNKETTMDILQVENINKDFKNKKVLEDINFSIKEGDIVALIGHNGAGKTTIMKIISALLEQDSGSVKICGIQSYENRSKYISNFASIIETPSLYETLSGYDNINFIRKINNISKEKMNEILKFINIGDAIKNKVKSYSLGMKQRLALGIALITEPKLLILDEPTNGLDPEGVIEFRELIKKFASENKMSILISSHILAELDRICNRFLFIKDGKLTEANNINESKAFQTVKLNVENLKETLDIISKLEFIDKVNIINSKVNIEVNRTDTPKLMSEIFNKNIVYSEIEIENNTIEKVYTDVYLGGRNE